MYVAEGTKIRNIIFGGGQQGGLRSGTENVAGIAAMAMAAERLMQSREEDVERLQAMRDLFTEEVTGLPDVRINGPAQDPESRELAAPHIVSVSTAGLRAEVLLHALEEKGIYVSAGSACSTHHREVRGTLDAIGLPKEYREGTLRVSFGVMNTEEEAKEAAAAFLALVPVLRQFKRR